MPRRAALLLTLILGAACGARARPVTVDPFDGSASAWPDSAPPFKVLVFTRTAGFRHASIPTAVAAVQALQAAGDYLATTTEDAAQFSPSNLARFQVVMFLLTTGDVLDAGQQAAFEAWIGAGGNFLGVHSAADTEHDWPFYGTLVGAYFVSHPDVQPAGVDADAGATGDPILAGLPSPWTRTDEWYNFDHDPRPQVTVLETVDESSYTGGTMGADHPITWEHPTGGGGRAFYTAMGHTDDSYRDPLFQRLLVGGLRWAAGR